MGSKYAYAFGRVRALEVGLVTASQLKRMTDARNAEEALKIVSETSYSAYLPEKPEISDIEKAILKELEKTCEISRKISPERSITDLFEVKYDIHNLKILLKSEIIGKSLSNLLIPLGREGADNIKAALAGDLKVVSPGMRDIIVKTRELYEKTKDFQKVQFFLDREHTRLLRNGFRGYPFLREFFAIKIDLENIRNYLRIQKYGLDFEKVFLFGGNFGLAFFEAAKDQPVEYFVEKTRNTNFAHVVSEGLAAYQKTGSLALYEKLTENFLMQYMRRAKFRSLSIEPLIGYLFAKEREASLIRRILVSKMKRINIQDRVSETYE